MEASSQKLSGLIFPLSHLDLAVLSSKFGVTEVLLLSVTICLAVLAKLSSGRQLSSGALKKIPGPWFQLPIVGYVPFLGSKPYIKLWQMSRVYGPIFQFKMGNRPVVVLNGVETIRTALSQNAKAFAGRPHFKSTEFVSGGKSLVLQTYNSMWNFRRKTAVRILSYFDNNKRYPIDSVLRDHGVVLADKLTESGVVHPLTHIEECIADIIHQLCFGSDFDDSSSLLKDKLVRFTNEVRELAMPVRLNDILPSSFTWVLQKQVQAFRKCFQEFDRLVTDKIDKILSADGGYRPGNPRCIADALQDVWNNKGHEIRQKQTVSDEETVLTRDHMLAIVQDLIGAASETIVSFFNWSILYMTKYPDIQARLRTEVESKIGTSRAPTSADRLAMPFVESFMWEVVRHSSLLPLGLPHSTINDVIINDMLISKNTLVIANLYSTGVDPAVWKEPDEFQPDRLLRSVDGMVDRDLLDNFLCFGAGKRKCIGAELARRTMFIILTVLIQKCKFEPVPDHPPLSLDGVLTTNSCAARPYLVKVTAY